MTLAESIQIELKIFHNISDNNITPPSYGFSDSTQDIGRPRKSSRSNTYGSSSGETKEYAVPLRPALATRPGRICYSSTIEYRKNLLTHQLDGQTACTLAGSGS